VRCDAPSASAVSVSVRPAKEAALHDARESFVHLMKILKSFVECEQGIGALGNR
jgi:hypothetical protein